MPIIHLTQPQTVALQEIYREGGNGEWYHDATELNVRVVRNLARKALVDYRFEDGRRWARATSSGRSIGGRWPTPSSRRRSAWESASEADATGVSNLIRQSTEKKGMLKS